MGNWIQNAIKNKGGLHKALKVPMGQNIPEGKINKAAGSDNTHLARMANLAKTLHKFNK